jgi:hypothetical protein
VPAPATWSTPPPGPPPPVTSSGGAKIALIIVGSLVGLGLLSVLALAVLGTESKRSFSSVGTAIGGPEDDGGDGGDDGAAPVIEPADVPDGYAVIEGDGVSIATPDSWKEIAPEDFALSDEEFARAFPNAPDGMLETGSSFFEQGAVLVAFDLGTEFASNVNIISIPGEAPLSLVESQAESQLGSLGAEVASNEVVQVASGEALRIEYTLDVATPGGGTIPASGVQYYLPLDGRTYIVTVSTGTDVGVLADTMMDTFRVT